MCKQHLNFCLLRTAPGTELDWPNRNVWTFQFFRPKAFSLRSPYVQLLTFLSKRILQAGLMITSRPPRRKERAQKCEPWALVTPLTLQFCFVSTLAEFTDLILFYLGQARIKPGNLAIFFQASPIHPQQSEV